jgi:hypothetical protein
MVVHLTLKNFLSLIVGACVVGLALITLLVDPQHLVWLRWQILVVALGIIAIVALLIQSAIQSKEDHEAKAREKARDERLKTIEVQLTQLTSTKHVETIVEPVQTTYAPQLAASPKTLEKPQEGDGIDGMVYRIAISPRTFAWEIIRDIFKMKGTADDARIDCDVLVEMYLVNTSKMEIAYLRDLELSAEIKGERFTLKLQDDLRANDFNGQEFEYGLKATRFDDAEPLKRLFTALPLAMQPKQPIEGWARFMAENINPDSITEKSWKLSVVDSLGDHHPINKAAIDRENKGEVGIRRLRG